MKMAIERSSKIFQIKTKMNMDACGVEDALRKYFETFDGRVELIKETPIDYSHIEIFQTIRMPIPIRFVKLTSDKKFYEEQVTKFFGITPNLGRISFKIGDKEYNISIEFRFTTSKDKGYFEVGFLVKTEEGHFYQYETVLIKDWNFKKTSTFTIIDDKRIEVEFYKEYNKKWDEEFLDECEK
jgi:hypothetical protein